MPLFGQLVIGPPGSGKTTYCKAMHEFLSKLGRKVAIVNLDPANDNLPYQPDIDIASLIRLQEVMEVEKLGPNGSLVYCMEFLEKNFDWLHQECTKLKDHYLLLDCPGQVELYTHHNSVRNTFQQLIKFDYRLTAVHLVDSFYCADPANFISVLLTSLMTMLQIELPHVNVLSKADLIEQYGKLAFNLEFYTEVTDLGYLMQHLENDPFFSKYKKLNDAICGVIEDYSLVSFTTLDVQSRESLLGVMKVVDRANGYVFGDVEERNIQSLLSYAVGAEFESDKVQHVQETYMTDTQSTTIP